MNQNLRSIINAVSKLHGVEDFTPEELQYLRNAEAALWEIIEARKEEASERG